MSKNADIKRLKEENEDLKSQIEKLVEKVDNLSQNVLSTKEASSAIKWPQFNDISLNCDNGRSGEQEEPLSSEKKKSVEFLSNQYDQVLKELDQIKAEIKE
ncbi:Hypothetical predicted protein, partial [Paramuricea clavata]